MFSWPQVLETYCTHWKQLNTPAWGQPRSFLRNPRHDFIRCRFHPDSANRHVWKLSFLISFDCPAGDLCNILNSSHCAESKKKSQFDCFGADCSALFIKKSSLTEEPRGVLLYSESLWFPFLWFKSGWIQFPPNPGDTLTKKWRIHRWILLSSMQISLWQGISLTLQNQSWLRSFWTWFLVNSNYKDIWKWGQPNFIEYLVALWSNLVVLTNPVVQRQKPPRCELDSPATTAVPQWHWFDSYSDARVKKFQACCQNISTLIFLPFLRRAMPETCVTKWVIECRHRTELPEVLVPNI